MPAVPRYESGVQAQVGGPNVNARANPDAFGAGIAEGLQQVAQGVGDLGLVATGHQIKMQEQDNAAAVDEALTKYAEGLNDLGYGDNGYYTKYKKQAVDDFAATKDSVFTMRKELGSTLANPAQQKAFDSASRSQMIYNLGNMSGHYASERKKWQVDTVQGGIDADIRTAQLNYANKEQREALIAGIREKRLQKGAMMGQDPIETQNDFFGDVKKVYTEGILQRALHDPEGAQAEADQYREMLGPDAYNNISQRLQPSLDAGTMEDILNSIELGGSSAVAHVGAFANAADAVGQIKKLIPNAVITSDGPAKSAAGKAARVPGSYHELPTGSQAVDLKVPGETPDQTAVRLKATWGATPGVKIIAENAGAAHSTGPHVHIQWEKTAPVATGSTPLDIRTNGQEYVKQARATAETMRPGDARFAEQVEAKARQRVNEAVTMANLGQQQASVLWYDAMETDRLNGVQPDLKRYMGNPTLANALHELDPIKANHIIAAVNSASRTPKVKTPEMWAEYSRLKGMALRPEAAPAFIKENIVGNPLLTDGWKSALLNAQLKAQNPKAPKDVNAPIGHALSLPPVKQAMAKMKLYFDPQKPNNAQSTKTMQFVDEYHEMINTFIAVHNRKPNDNDLYHMFNQLATVSGNVVASKSSNTGRAGDKWQWELGAGQVVEGVPNDDAQSIAAQLRENELRASPELIKQVYSAKQAQKGK